MSNNTITVNYGTGNTFAIPYVSGMTIGHVLANANLRARFGFGSNVEGHLNGVPQPNGTVLHAGETVSIFDKQCGKAAAITVNVVYGTGNSRPFTFEVPVTVKQVLAAAGAPMGFNAARVEGHLNGVPQPDTTTLLNGETLYVFDKQCGKAR